MTDHILRTGFAALGIVLAAVVVAEISIGALGSTVSVDEATADASVPEMPMPSDIDSMVAEILERPLFASARAPYEEAAVADEESEDEDMPQTIRVRLTGVAILPGEREALFEREGSKPVAVKEGGQIDGWMVKAIRADRVVLANDWTEKVLELVDAPSNGKRVAANAASAAQAQAKGAPTIRAPQASPGGKQDHK